MAGQEVTDRTAGSRWARGVAAGLVLALPLGCLLSYLAFLPAMLGLFFFVLFGLVIGAAMFRVWEPLRPMTRSRIRRGVLIVGLAGWMTSLVWEGVTFPHQAAKEAIRQVTRPVEGTSPQEIKAAAKDSARAFLAEHYPPGGVLGYWRWAVTGQRVEIPITGVGRPKPIRLGNTGALFLVRVALSGLALTAAIGAMVKPLSRPPTPRGEEPAAPVLH